MARPDNLVTDRVLRRGQPITEALRRYHRYRIVGLSNVPDDGGALIALSHSLATYDGFLMAAEIHDRTGRMMVGLGDDSIFRTPGLGRVALEAGLRPANPENGARLLREGHLVGVAPGGMREALRPSDERYRVRWDRRKGFVRLALRAGTPLLLAACPAADDLYTVYPSTVTARAYKRFKVPLPLIRGWGPTLLPRPVALTHHIGPPIQPPPAEPDGPGFEAQVDALHARVVAAMDDLMATALDP